MTQSTILAPGFYLKCGSHFMCVNDYTSFVKLNSGEQRFDTEQDAITARYRAQQMVWKCPPLDIVEIQQTNEQRLADALQQRNLMASMGWGNARHKNHAKFVEAEKLWLELKSTRNQTPEDYSGETLYNGATVGNVLPEDYSGEGE